MLELEAQHRLGDTVLELSLQVAAGTCLVLAGPSGAGKTSALRIVAGLLAPAAGRVRCGEQVWLDTANGVALAPERRSCGYVFQDLALFGHMAVWRNVAYAERSRNAARRRRRAIEVLDRFGVAALADRRPAEISGGERQRVAVARALFRTPRALLLDEPLASLDPRSRASAARELAAAVSDAGVPAILVTHDFFEGTLVGDRIAVMDRGRIVQVGTPTDVAAAPASGFVADFTGAIVLPGTARRREDGLTAVELDGGGTVLSSDQRAGPVAATVHPNEIVLEKTAGPPAEGSAQNRMTARVVSVTPLGARARVALAASAPLLADVTRTSARALNLAAGDTVAAVWKATATRLVDR